MKREAGRLALTLLACIVAGYLLLTAAYCIPMSAIQRNLADSMKQLSGELKYPRDAISGRQLDNFTDALMLLEVYCDVDAPAYVNAANTPYVTLKGSDPHESLSQIARRPGNFRQVNDYSRYWHGYQVLLRPLLLLFSYRQIRVVNAVALAALLIAVAALMCLKTPRCVIPFLLSVLLLGPTAIWKSMQFSSVSYITLLTLLAILWNPGGIIESGKIRYAFLFSGIAVAYFDLLTFPTMALTMPLILLCTRIGKGKWLSEMVRCAFYWGVGYVGMWAGKWLIAIAFGGGDFLQTLLSQIRFHSGTNGDAERIGRLDAVMLNVRTMFEGQTPIVVGIVGYAAAMVALNQRRYRRPALLPPGQFAVAMIPAAIGLIWICLLSSHSGIHYWFTYRTLVPCVFCILCALGAYRRKATEDDKNG